MSTKLQPVRGTQDLFGDTYWQHHSVLDTAEQWAIRYGYHPIATPIFEFTEVFSKTAGETSDIVTKEMYNFVDRGGESITLRPEGTAGVARAFLSHGWMQSLPCRFYYSGPNFRYERPQKGRLRQFHQFGVEQLGIASSIADIECIALGVDILNELGVLSSSKLCINSLGDQETRLRYRQSLVDYLTPYASDLSEDSKARLSRNPLRILDSKDLRDQEILQHAPTLQSVMTPESLSFFDQVLDGLTKLRIDFTLEPKLVRGLDYYCHTIFEFVTENLGSQGTVLAGGRYDGMMETMGGPSTPAIGWALGVERLAMMLSQFKNIPTTVYFVCMSDDLMTHGMNIVRNLRHQGLRVELVHITHLKKALNYANKKNAEMVIIMGEHEQSNHHVQIKNFKSGTQHTISIDKIFDFLKQSNNLKV